MRPVVRYLIGPRAKFFLDHGGKSMAFRDPLAAYNAESNLEAHMVCDLLVEAGIDAQVIEDYSETGAIRAPEIHKPQVWIERGDAERAAPVLAAYEERRIARVNPHGEPITVTCPECKKPAIFPASLQGFVETCPNCGDYLDIEPDPPGASEGFGPMSPARAAAVSDNPYLAPTDDGQAEEPLPTGPLAFFLWKGRITRSEWWTIRIGFVLLIYALDWAHRAEMLSSWVEGGAMLGYAWLLLVSDIKRWHDHGRSGYWAISNFVLCVGQLLAVLMQGFTIGTPGPNPYGPDPLGRPPGPETWD